VVTLHDIIYMEKSAWGIVAGEGSAYQRFGNLYRRSIVPRVMKTARTIVTVSDFEKERIREWCGQKAPQQLETVYNGVSDYFRPVTDPKMQQRARDRYRLPERYFFFLGNTHPKKNTIGVLKAFSEYRKIKSNDTKLLMLDYDREELQRLLRSIDDPGLASEIVLTGYVDNRDLPAIYSLSRLFLYPSLRESFGIPIIEAMACGTPVITSNTSSMPEVSGGAALLIDPFHPDELTKALIRLDQDDDLRASLSAQGLQRAIAFSWKHAAERMLDIYEHTN
jgi:glycosyltransferase involved in cell wall biosynthesis